MTVATIPVCWSNESKKLAEKYPALFQKNYPSRMNCEADHELQFVFGAGIDLYFKALGLEKINPTEAKKIYAEATGAYKLHIDLAQKAFLTGSEYLVKSDMTEIDKINRNLERLGK
jgi:hypothetical protein